MMLLWMTNVLFYRLVWMSFVYFIHVRVKFDLEVEKEQTPSEKWLQSVLYNQPEA